MAATQLRRSTSNASVWKCFSSRLLHINTQLTNQLNFGGHPSRFLGVDSATALANINVLLGTRGFCTMRCSVTTRPWSDSFFIAARLRGCHHLSRSHQAPPNAAHLAVLSLCGQGIVTGVRILLHHEHAHAPDESRWWWPPHPSNQHSMAHSHLQRCNASPTKHRTCLS
mmetsp:Transcript_39916/g.93636  ORF Transcript_39916/g.93636 Transcript_39916/m.93636 type:complete len:169 (+) Transcript_39916:452-958(+)